jgi:hypothetical protein
LVVDGPKAFAGGSDVDPHVKNLGP